MNLYGHSRQVSKNAHANASFRLLAVQPKYMNAPEPIRIKNADIIRDGGSYMLSYESKDGGLFVLKLPAIMSQEFKLQGYRAPAVRGFNTDNEPALQLTWAQAQILRTKLLPLLSPDIGMGGIERAVAMLALIEQEGRTAQQSPETDDPASGEPAI